MQVRGGGGAQPCASIGYHNASGAYRGNSCRCTNSTHSQIFFFFWKRSEEFACRRSGHSGVIIELAGAEVRDHLVRIQHLRGSSKLIFLFLHFPNSRACARHTRDECTHTKAGAHERSTEEFEVEAYDAHVHYAVSVVECDDREAAHGHAAMVLSREQTHVLERSHEAIVHQNQTVGA